MNQILICDYLFKTLTTVSLFRKDKISVMVRIISMDVFINGTQMSEPDGDVPFRAIAAFVKRLMLDLTEPNSESGHDCSEDCRHYFELLIGTKELGGFENCIPR